MIQIWDWLGESESDEDRKQEDIRNVPEFRALSPVTGAFHHLKDDQLTGSVSQGLPRVTENTFTAKSSCNKEFNISIMLF